MVTEVGRSVTDYYLAVPGIYYFVFLPERQYSTVQYLVDNNSNGMRPFVIDEMKSLIYTYLCTKYTHRAYSVSCV
jgi:hypothetical protein